MDYGWQELVPNRRIGRWTHPGVTSLGDAGFAVTDPQRSAVILFTPDAHLDRRIPVPVREVHDLTTSGAGGQQSLWLADPGFALQVHSGRLLNPHVPGQVVRIDLNGTVHTTIVAPPIPIHTIHAAAFRPTSLAVAEGAFGGSGEVWVADGYGTGLVHQFDRDGTYLKTISGEEGRAGAFRNPHGLTIAARRGEPELIVADRHNSRLQVYDLDGRFKRQIVDPHVVTPSALAVHGHRLLIAELDDGIVVLDEADRYVETILPGGRMRPEGWPNRLIDGRIQRPELRAGQFRSPHGMAVLADGSIVVAEWVLGGRVVRLIPVEGSLS